MAWIERIITFLSRLLGWDTDIDHVEAPKQPVVATSTPAVPKPTEPVKPPVQVKTKREKLYDLAVSCLGKRMGLDKSVPIELNCANALSHVLILAGVKGLPPKGIAGTANLYAWLKKSKEFELVSTPLLGDVLCYPTGFGNGKVSNGHVFIMGKKNPMSNNSATGKWDAHWDSLKEADDYYTKKGAIPRFTFRIK